MHNEYGKVPKLLKLWQTIHLITYLQNTRNLSLTNLLSISFSYKCKNKQKSLSESVQNLLYVISLRKAAAQHNMAVSLK